MAALMKQMTLRELVRKCVADGVIDPDAIAARVDVQEAGEELVHECIREGIASAVSKDQSETRTIWKAESVRPSSVNAENARRSAVARATRLFETWLVSGRPLGKCDKAALSEAAANERGSARGHLVNAAFYDALAAKCRGNKTVDAVMKEDEAIELLRLAQAA